MKGKRLRKNAAIAVVAPSGPTPEEKTKKGIAFLESMGYQVLPGESVFSKHGYLSAPDDVRVRDLHWAFADPEIDAVFCLRGGYGTPRLLPLLDYELIRANPKIFVGFSDITALHIAFRQKCGLITFHGPMVGSEMANPNEYNQSWFWRALTRPVPLGRLQNPADGSKLECLVPGVAEGELVGGNLSLLAATIGTPFEIDTKGKVLFLEDIGEEPYRVDRMLTQLILAGKMNDAAGFVLGEWTDCAPKNPEKSFSLIEVLRDRLAPFGKPVLYNLCAGHGDYNITLPLGVKTRLDAGKLELTILESGVE